MATVDIIRAWKDEDYRDTLTTEQRTQLPDHPSGIIEFGKPKLDDESLFGPEAGHCKFITKSTSTGQCSTHSPGHCK